MFSLLDGRGKLYQWDLDRKLTINDNTIIEVHFANCLCPVATVCRSYEEDGATVVDIPNELLTEYMDIRVWGFDGKATKHEQVFEVEKKTKPAEYIYTPTEVWTVEKAVEEALEEAKASGDFKGDKGDKGDAGAIDFIVVAELPAIGDGSKIYLMPETDGEEPNRFGEYVFIEGAWERIGSAGVEVNLDEYVKNTDYANSVTAGLVRVMGEYGVQMVSPATGTIGIRYATDAEIDEKTSAYRSIAPKNLDYAVKSGLADNKLEWTDDEKASARGLLGAVGETDFATADGTKAGIVKLKPNTNGGITVNSDGQLSIQAPSISNMKARDRNKPLTSAELENAIWLGITGYKETWNGKQYVGSYGNQKQLTDEEKATACSWMGALKEQHPEFSDGSIRGYAYCINPSGEQVLLPTTIVATANTIALRNPTGNFYISTPTLQYECANKGYVDNLIAELTARIEALEGVSE